MDLIPTWVRRLWDVWDLRVLVLLSFTLQLILSIFGNRRKNISSLWISVLVWSTYVTADWVATVALGKLSDGDPEKSNVLWAIWAPLLLLRLGGPDSITAYSLEDNQLWMRHLLGLVVQLFVAIYVILMSWENSWFSFISLPALVAGLIKYGERTWVLKLVSGDNYINTLPMAKRRGQYENCLGVLILAHNRLEEFGIYLKMKGLPLLDFPTLNIVDSRIWFDAVEVTMGFMYDLLYTKATIVHRDEFVEFWAPFRNLNTQPFGWKFGSLHLATEVCYQLEIEWDGGEDPSGSNIQNREVCKVVSDYVMYLLVMHPSLLPDDGTGPILETFFERPENLTKDARDKIGACRNWMERGLGFSRHIAEELKRKGNLRRWEILKLMWWETLKKAVAGPKGFGQRNAHFQRLREGGEFLTFMWFCDPTYLSHSSLEFFQLVLSAEGSQSLDQERQGPTTAASTELSPRHPVS
ncbi:hypothetical protein Vadar_011093 [Vaccinium darrowii]|uniref:Uncharacterized protein n=1 Tax=Vaccinium darrowii TaxID=229202 RepID=A0ACB7Z3H3_9ERIC|nr:hypothetical protein Vadar_011093 [Vaccinium darrowii]